jgi:WD40 repeat protein
MTTILTTSKGIWQWRDGSSPKRLPGLDKDEIVSTTASPDGSSILNTELTITGNQVAIIDHGDVTIHALITHTSKKVRVAKVHYSLFMKTHPQNANLISFSHDSKILFFTSPSKDAKEHVVKAYKINEDRIESTFHVNTHPTRTNICRLTPRK